jgi:hypothetical protein
MSSSTPVSEEELPGTSGPLKRQRVVPRADILCPSGLIFALALRPRRRRFDDRRMPAVPLLPTERIERVIHVIRGQKVMLDFDLASLYEVETKVLNQAVRRNIERFPGDFMFILTEAEVVRLRSQFVTTKKGGRGGRRTAPYAFTEQGVAMLSSVLRSPRAVQVNIEIMRAFVRLRQMLQSNADLARKLAALEKKYDAQFRVVFDAIRELMAPPPRPRRIGFRANDR